MYIFGYLRASTSDQNAKRAQGALQGFVQQKGFRIAGWYIENESGASLQRPELLRLLDDAAIIIEQIDRLSRLDEEIKKAKEEGKYRGRQADSDLHEKIYQLRVINKLSISDTAKLTNVSARTVIRVAQKLASERSVAVI